MNVVPSLSTDSIRSRTQNHDSLSLRRWVSVWAALSKVRLTGLVVSTALAGCALAAPSSPTLLCEAFLQHPAASLLALGLGTTLTSASANSINQVDLGSHFLKSNLFILINPLIIVFLCLSGAVYFF